MAEKKPAGSKQAADRPKKLLKSGKSPDIGKATQFKKGQSGNPAGTKPGTKHLSTWIREMLNDEDFVALLPDPRDGWREEKGPPLKAIVRTAAIRAMEGEKESREWLAKYGYGTKIEVTGADGEPLIPVVRIIDERDKPA